MLEDEMHRALPDFFGVPRSSFHDSILSRVGASEKPGAVHIWKRHELESYLLIPSAIARLTGLHEPAARALLEDALELVKEEAFAGLFGTRAAPLRGRGVSDKSVAQICRAELDQRWGDAGPRLALCPAKETLAALNRLLQEGGRKALTTRRLSAALTSEEIPDEMRSALEDVQAMVAESQ